MRFRVQKQSRSNATDLRHWCLISGPQLWDVVSNPAPAIVEFVRLKSSLKERNFAGTKWLVLQNIISGDGSSCQHRIFPEMSSQNSYSDITTRVAITSYKIAKNVWFYVSQFKYANTIETLGTLAKSGTPNPL